MVTNCIFQEPWWLDAVAPGAWKAVEVEENGAVVARLPWVERSRLGRAALVQGDLTFTLGPAVAPVDGKYTLELGYELDRLAALVERLPRFDLYEQNFAPEATNWLPFYWAGFEATVRYTYRIDDPSDPERIWAGFESDTRGAIRKAEKQLEVQEDQPVDELLKLHATPYVRQGVEPPSESVIRRLDAACVERGARLLLVARDAQGRAHSAAYAAGDERAMFGLLQCRNEEVSMRGSAALLVWETLKRMSGRTRIFDFGGSMLQGPERFLRQFGGRQTPYFRVRKAQGVVRPVESAGELVRSVLRRRNGS